MAIRARDASVNAKGRLIRPSATLLMAVLLLAGCTAQMPASPTPTPRAVPPAVDPIQQYADARLSVMTLEEKISSMIMAHLAGVDAASMRDFADANDLGGLILMPDNIPEPAQQLATLTPTMSAEPGLPLLIATDQEGGVVERIPSDTPAAAALRELPADAAREAFAARGALLASLGISVNFGIVADVTPDTSSFIFDRTLGDSVSDAAPRVSAAVTGELGMVLSTLKHFPGHGVAPGDSHSSIPATDMGLDEWRSTQAGSFVAGIDAGAPVVMLGHLQFDSIDPTPATLSARWQQILRDELGFEGITITDDMNMLEYSGRPDLADQEQNAVRAVTAGNTMLLYVGSVDLPGVVGAISDAVRAGDIPETVVDDAARRLLVLRRTLSGETGPFVHCFERCQSVIE